MNLSIKKTFTSLTLLFIALCIATAIFILFIGFSDDIHPSDVGIILGNQVYRNGQPSARLEARLNKGIQLYQQGFFHHIIVSGGIEKNGQSEAVVMRNYLVAHHIPATVIIQDNHGSNTWKTAINTKNIMQKQNYKSAVVISQYFHIARILLAFKLCGISPVYHAHANYFEWRDLYSLPREVVAIYYYCFFHH